MRATPRLKFGLARNDAGAWGVDEPGPGDAATTLWRSTEVDSQGSWVPEPEPAERYLSGAEARSTALDRGDLLVTKSSGSAIHVGKAALVTEAQSGDGYSNFMQRLRPRGDQDPKYLWYLLNSRVARSHYDRVATTTSGLRNLNGTLIGEMPLPLVDLPEQRRVAEFLNRECSRIAALDAACEAQPSTLEQHAARVHDEMLAAEGSVPLKVLLRDSCVGIVVQPARLYVADGEVPCLRAVNVQAGEIVREDLQRISRASHEANARSELQAGDVVVVRSGQAGAAAVVRDWAIGANCVDLLVLRPGPACESHWLVEVLNSEAFMGEVKRLTVGTIQGHMNLSVVRRIHCPAQPVLEQVQVVERIQAARAETRAMRSELIGVRRLLLEYRDALVTEAVTGKLDVPRLSETQSGKSARAVLKDERPEVHA